MPPLKIPATREHSADVTRGPCPERADHALSERDEHRGTRSILRGARVVSRSPARGRIRRARRSRCAVPGALRARTWGFFRDSAGIDIENGGLDRPRDRSSRARTTFPDSNGTRTRPVSLSGRSVALRDARVSAIEAPRTRVPIGSDPIANNASTDRSMRTQPAKRERCFFSKSSSLTTTPDPRVHQTPT